MNADYRFRPKASGFSTGPPRSSKAISRCRQCGMCDLAAVVLLLVAAGESGRAGELGEIRYNTIVLGTGTIDVSEVEGVQYRRITPEDLKWPQFDGTLCCVEGKFRELRGDAILLVGCDREFVLEDVTTFPGLFTGDNVWLAGQAKKYKKDPERLGTCYLLVRHIQRLPEDKELFDRRFRRESRKRDWQGLIRLGKWIGRAGEIVERQHMGEARPYQGMQRKAFRRALEVKRRGLKKDDAQGHYEIGRLCLSLLNDGFRAKAEFRAALHIDPKHEGARKELMSRFGLVEYKGHLVTPEEKKQLIARESADTGVPSATTEYVDVLSREKRAMAIYKVEQLLRSEPAGKAFPKLEKVFSKTQDVELLRHIVFLFVTGAGPHGLDGLISAQKCASSTVRMDVADALSWLGSPEAGQILVELTKANANDSPEIAIHSVHAIAHIKVNDRGSDGKLDRKVAGRKIGELVEVCGTGKPIVDRAAIEHLAALTGQDFLTQRDWRSWWGEAAAEWVAGSQESSAH